MNSINVPSEIAQIELVYKPNSEIQKGRKVTCSKDVYEAFKSVWNENKIQFVESFKVMLLNRANKIIGVVEISTGGTAGTVVDPKLVFAASLKGNAQAIILAHNHPSGNLIPSEQDKRLTSRLKNAGKILDIPVLDHLIVTAEGYFSFADEGEL